MEKPTVPMHAAHGTLDSEWQAFLDRAVGPGERYDQIRALGGMAKARERWKREEQTTSS
jgi:hypothetical protein